MKEENNLICIYDDTKEDLKQLLLDIYTTFLERELDLIDRL